MSCFPWAIQEARPFLEGPGTAPWQWLLVVDLPLLLPENCRGEWKRFFDFSSYKPLQPPRTIAGWEFITLWSNKTLAAGNRVGAQDGTHHRQCFTTNALPSPLGCGRKGGGSQTKNEPIALSLVRNFTVSRSKWSRHRAKALHALSINKFPPPSRTSEGWEMVSPCGGSRFHIGVDCDLLLAMLRIRELGLWRYVKEVLCESESESENGKCYFYSWFLSAIKILYL